MIVFDKITTDILSNFKFQPLVTELLIHGRKLGFSFFLSYFAEPKYIRLNSTQYFIMKIPSK